MHPGGPPRPSGMPVNAWFAIDEGGVAIRPALRHAANPVQLISQVAAPEREGQPRPADLGEVDPAVEQRIAAGKALIVEHGIGVERHPRRHIAGQRGRKGAHVAGQLMLPAQGGAAAMLGHAHGVTLRAMDATDVSSNLDVAADGL